ncbi:MAG: hypothetical protein IT287_09175 [Bdellovibrionaceae bacterium]|nr:hypothetical protein [Pseudobdellovibrionaceae bacterium]
MKNLFEEYASLFPKERAEVLSPLLSKVPFLRIPEDSMYTRTTEKQKTVLIYKNKTKQIVELLANGFEHAVCSQREDFSSELLCSALMTLRPDSFLKNPLPFFFNGFDPNSEGSDRKDNNFTVTFDSTEQKEQLMEHLVKFWSKRSAIASLQDICLQIADEMFTNIFFNAPVDARGLRPLKQQSRTTTIHLPERYKAKMFSCYTDEKVIIGCEDPFGSISRNEIMFRLESIYLEAMSAPRAHTAGSGLGLKFLIDNSANFYLFSEKGKKTIFACGLILKGLKANLTASKNIHFVVR